MGTWRSVEQPTLYRTSNYGMRYTADCWLFYFITSISTREMKIQFWYTHEVFNVYYNLFYCVDKTTHIWSTSSTLGLYSGAGHIRIMNSNVSLNLFYVLGTLNHTVAFKEFIGLETWRGSKEKFIPRTKVRLLTSSYNSCYKRTQGFNILGN